MGKAFVPKRNHFIKAADDICEICGLEDETGGKAIDTSKKSKTNDIKEKIIEAAQFIEEEDMEDLLLESIDVLNFLDCAPSFDDEENEDELNFDDEENKIDDIIEDDGDDEEDEEDEDDEKDEDDGEDEKDEEDEENLLDVLERTSKLKDLKDLVKKHTGFQSLINDLDSFKGLQGPRKLKPKMFDLLNAHLEVEHDTPEPAPKKNKKPDLKVLKPQMRRYDAVVDAIKELGKGGFSTKDIVLRSDEIFVANGGNSNITATNVARYTILALYNFSILKLKDGRYFLA